MNTPVTPTLPAMAPVLAPGSSPSNFAVSRVKIEEAQEEFGRIASEKKRIVSHPLFPVLETLLLQCEEASFSISKPWEQKFERIRKVVEEVRSKHGKNLSCGDREVDSLVLAGIRMLYIQLLELGKVNDLCKEFCDRYTSCIKTRINQETLLGFPSESDEELEPPTSTTSPSDQNCPLPVTQVPTATSNATLATIQTAKGPLSVHLFDPCRASVPLSFGHTHWSEVNAAPGLLLPETQVSASQQTPPLRLQPDSSTTGSLTLPTISADQSAASIQEDDSAYYHHLDISDRDSNSSVESLPGQAGGCLKSHHRVKNGANSNNNSKRTSLPRKSVEQLKSWLFQHVMHPYPSEIEKKQLSQQTGLNMVQVNNWFINARRRILHPMLEGHSSTTTPEAQTSDSDQVEGRQSQAAGAQVAGTSSPPAKRRPSVTTDSELSVETSISPINTRPQLTSAQRYWPLANFGANLNLEMGAAMSFGFQHMAGISNNSMAGGSGCLSDFFSQDILKGRINALDSGQEKQSLLCKKES